MLAEAVRSRRLVAVCGAHGKTTTTAMLITALQAANFPAGYVLGGLPADGAAPARVGSNGWVVAEVDESDGTIGAFSPEITVTVNLDWDHPDYYHAPADLEAAFARLFARTRGTVLVSDACPRSVRLALTRPAGAAADAGPRVHTFGRSGEFAAEVAEETRDRLTLRLGGCFTSSTAIVRAQGEFNAANATGALAALQTMGVALGPRLLADYPGVRRRQSVLSADGGVTVVEDYAHHPTEIRALLTSLRRRVGQGGRLVVVFQPHRYSRTAQFAAEFAAALALADQTHLLDVYGAGEAPLPGGTSADIYAEIKKSHGTLMASYLPGGAGTGAALAREIRSGDVVAFVGAGDIERYARDWLEERRALVRQADRWDEFAAELGRRVSPATRVRREEPLARRTTLRVGGSARVYAEPVGEADLRILIQESRARGIGLFFLGRGSNLIVPDEGVDGLVISLADESWAGFAPQPDGSIRVGAGLRLKHLCGRAAAAGLTGFEFLEGIPGSVGGALRMNAGAMGGWMFDVVESVELMTLDGEMVTLPKAALHVDYRQCAEVRDGVALAARLRPGPPGATDGIERQIETYRRQRHETQPREPSAGCIFKNPPGESAGRLIDESGLKGERVGGAEVSSVHANFIVNRGGATSADVLALMRKVRGRVRERRGIDLEPEALLYGRRWEDVW
jgi:UDP-N-acetylenolpyruvoylglucosamine reductase